MSVFVGSGGMAFTSSAVVVGSPTGIRGGLSWSGSGEVVP